MHTHYFTVWVFADYNKLLWYTPGDKENGKLTKQTIQD